MKNTEELNMSYMNAKEAVRAMEWARAHGHSEKEAIELVEYITERGPLKVESDEKETKE